MKIIKRTGKTLRELWSNNRSFFWQVIGLLVASLVIAIITASFVRPQQLRVVSRYSDFGATHFYHEAAWTYLLSFPVLALAIGFLHMLIILRLVRSEQVTIARAVIFLSYALLIAILIIAFRLAGINREFL
ncbi:hypothetical protein FWH13_01285 [Candidatus Saccharibacteria bacterium]|nr:hypothetical protein [Candidatus Saccharibacteria bacterium]